MLGRSMPWMMTDLSSLLLFRSFVFLYFIQERNHTRWFGLIISMCRSSKTPYDSALLLPMISLCVCFVLSTVLFFIGFSFAVKQNVLNKEAIEEVLASLTGSLYKDQKVFRVINAFEISRMRYDPIRKLFYR